jgi:hypothetical protein
MSTHLLRQKKEKQSCFKACDAAKKICDEDERLKVEAERLKVEAERQKVAFCDPIKKNCLDACNYYQKGDTGCMKKCTLDNTNCMKCPPLNCTDKAVKSKIVGFYNEKSMRGYFGTEKFAMQADPITTSFGPKFMVPKRRFWKAKKIFGNVFSKHFSHT